MTKQPVIHWDTNVFIAWLQDEKRPHNEMADLTAVVDEVMKKKVTLITSVITLAEIQQAKISSDNLQRFDDLFSWPNVNHIDVTSRIADLVGKLRSHYRDKSKSDNLPVLALGDAIQVATGLHYQAEIIHTFDGKHKRDQRGLLTLDGDQVEDYTIRISKPSAVTSDQTMMDLQQPTEGDLDIIEDDE